MNFDAFDKTKLRAAVFDLGNTLMEFETRPFEELNRLGAESAFNALDSRPKALDAGTFVARFEAEFKRVMSHSRATDCREFPLTEIFPEVLRSFSLPVAAAEIRHLVRAHYAPIVNQVSLYSDTRQTLEFLKAQGLRLGLISNTIWPEEFHREDLERYGILHLFDAMTFSSTLGTAKPGPGIFQDSLSQLDLKPEEAFYVGDRIKVDVKGAQEVGMAGVLKRHPRRQEPLDGVVPQGIIQDLSELKEWIKV